MITPDRLLSKQNRQIGISVLIEYDLNNLCKVYSDLRVTRLLATALFNDKPFFKEHGQSGFDGGDAYVGKQDNPNDKAKEG